MTLSKRHPKGGSEAREAAAADDESAAVEESTPYKGSRCCVGFFQCHVCGHEWSSVYSWANSSQSCKPCSSRRRQTWVLPYRQIPKSRKYEFFCVDCDQYIAESYRARDAHQGIACKTCEALVFPDWEFPCDQCNIVHLYSFSKTEAMRGIDCDCGGFLFPKHMKSLNKKHESRYCQKCQELGVNCCNFKASKEEPKAEMMTTTTKTPMKTKEPAGRPKKKPVQKRPAPRPRVSESSVEERGGAERKATATTRKSVPKQRQRASVSSVEGEAPPPAAAGKKPARRPAPKQRQQQQRVSVSSVEVEAVEKKPSRRPAGMAPRTGGGGGDFSEARENIPSKSRPSAARGGKKTTQRVATVVVADENASVRSANRGGRSAPRGGGGRGGRGGGPKPRNHVYADEDVLRAAPTPKNSVAVDPGIAEKPARKPGKPRAQRQRPRNTAAAGRNGAKYVGGVVGDAEVDALADQVAESIIISATRDVEAKAAPRQQKDENDNKVDDNNNNDNDSNNNEEKRFVLVPAAESVSPKPKASAVELKGGHPPAVKVGGRRRVSSGRKSESEGKKPAAEAQSAEAAAQGDAVVAAAAAPSDDKLAEADPEMSQVQLAAKSRMAVNHSEVSAVPEKPFPTKDVNSKIANVHPHYPTNKHPIQQPRKC